MDFFIDLYDLGQSILAFDWTWGGLADIGLNVVGLIPGVGDLAKASRLGKNAIKTVDAVADVTDGLNDARKAIKRTDALVDASKAAKNVGNTADALDTANDASKALKNADENIKTVITSEQQEKILYGKRTTGNKFIGGHSPKINNSNPEYAVEIIKENSDGTKSVKYITEFEDGNLSKIKNSTLFPESWSDENIIDAVYIVGGTPVVGFRGNQSLHSGTINGVDMEVIKNGVYVESAYPTGGKKHLGSIR